MCRAIVDLESHLLKAWADGDAGAGDALLRRLLPGIYGLCLRILKSDADAQDASQETMARLCAGVRNGDGIRNVKKWAATVAMNLCFDARRKKTLEILEEPEAPVESEPLPSVDPARMREAMRKLPERYQAVLHCHFVLGLKPRDFAPSFDLEPGTARVLLHRALAALRRNLS